ncbi:MAG: hypothetical protein EOP04_00255 [Proteobacteria bacterium]|nr:MAG: hypothetical protein EOP04_00255 [Pseudomonadota bacterium]
MNADTHKRPTYASTIESFPDGSFVLYPYGNQVFREKSGRFFIDCFRSKNIGELKKIGRFYKSLPLIIVVLAVIVQLLYEQLHTTIMPLIPVNFGLVAISLWLALGAVVAFIIEILNIFLPTALTSFFPHVQSLTLEIDTSDVEKILRENKKPRFSRTQNIFGIIILTLCALVIFKFVWNMIAYRADPTFWDKNISYSLSVVVATSFLGTLLRLRRFPSTYDSRNFIKTFFPIYFGLSVAWIVTLFFLGYPLSYMPPSIASEIPVIVQKIAKTDVEWRTEIRRDEEPETWPFKESRYMLSCVGIDGNYSVYIVKFEDTLLVQGRAKGFLPQYYGLKASRPGWQNGETQLLQGKSAKAFEKYVALSLDQCRIAEARKKS